MKIEPVFLNDVRLLINARAILYKESRFKFYVAILGFAIVNFVLVYLIFEFLNFSGSLSINPLFISLLIITLLVIGRAVSKFGFYVKYPSDIYPRFHFIGVEIYENVKRSIINYRISKKRVGEKYFNLNQYNDFNLKEKPNLFFLLIESYGKIFYDECKTGYSQLVDFKQAISKSGWGSVSCYSTSPISGGQSWLAYSTFLFGTKINNNSYFENLFWDSHFSKSRHLLNALRNNGYSNYNLNPTKPIQGIKVHYEQMQKFYSIDEWILFDDIDYNGDVYGWNEGIPDQYVMNFAKDLIDKKGKEPYTFFYLSKNSHSPFITPELVGEWKTLSHDNEIKKHLHTGFLSTPKWVDYENSINYQLDNLKEFIVNRCGKNDIVIVLGDHQPPILSDSDENGFDTPVHIISKDKQFLSNFEHYGFKHDLENCTTSLNHESLSSMFLREFVRAYGIYDHLPNYEPNGVQIL